MEKKIEYTYIMIKPDGVEKKVLDDVIRRFEKADRITSYNVCYTKLLRIYVSIEI